mgnify:FL=1
MFQEFFVNPLTNILKFLNLYLNDLGLSIIVFSIFLKILISPLSFLQFKEELKLKKINEKINKLAKKEKDIFKKAEIISKVYEEEKFNPIYNMLVQFSTLPFYLATIFVIQNSLKTTHLPLFLNLIDLTKPSIVLSFLVIIFQIFFLFNQPKENRKVLLFVTAFLSVIIFFFSSAFLLYFLVILALNLLERKLFNLYYIKFSIVSVKEDDPYRS